MGAVSYLHARRIIHGDLSANNVLRKTQPCRKGYVCKVCDFGLARVLDYGSTGILTNQLGCVPYMPPELFDVDNTPELSYMADVYSFGVILWQVVGGQVPWKGLSAPAVVV